MPGRQGSARCRVLAVGNSFEQFSIDALSVGLGQGEAHDFAQSIEMERRIATLHGFPQIECAVVGTGERCPYLLGAATTQVR